jgi:hypothetical protein
VDARGTKVDAATGPANDYLALQAPGGRHSCSAASRPRSPASSNAAVTADELLVRLLYDLDLAEARLACSPRLRGRPLGLLVACSYALSTRCAAERIASQEGSRPANVLVGRVVQAGKQPTPADLIPIGMCPSQRGPEGE